MALCTGACTNGSAGKELHTLDTLTFKTGFPITVARSGVFSDVRDGKEYVYFADVVTNKKLLYFSPAGVLLDSIPLKQAADALGSIYGLAVLAPDTILLTSGNAFDMALIDRKGTVIRMMHLGSALRLNNDAQYEIWPYSNSFVLNGKAFMNVSLVADSLPEPAHPPDNPFDNVLRYYLQSACSPFLVEMDLRADSPVLRWGVDSFYYKLDSINPLMPEAGGYTCLNDMIFVHSMYSPSIIVVDPESLREVSRFGIAFNHDETSSMPIQMIDGGVPNLQDSVDARYRRGAHVVSVRYDQPTHHYLLVLQHASPGSAAIPAEKSARSYSLLEYGDRFQFIREFEFEEGKYEPYFMLGLKYGTYVRLDLGQRADMMGTHRFVRLNLNEIP
jgi:hypothetical protein